MADKTDDERVSIWSTGDTERTWLIFLASVFFYPSLAFVVWQSIENDLYKTIVNAIEAIGPVGLSAITLAFFIIEGSILCLFQSKNTAQNNARRDGRKDSRKCITSGLNGLRKLALNTPICRNRLLSRMRRTKMEVRQTINEHTIFHAVQEAIRF